MTKDIEFELREQLESQRRWAAMSPEQKKKHLLQRQKEMLDKFLERNAISREQYDKSVGVLRRAAG
ncbi:MAG: hypothetical protein IKH16_00055 [Selenomonadaceae bacterium]|nr:hypothetical protein [Selenomonadaceae bacterium]